MENKFGMFIHWGFYSLLGVQEQVLARNDMKNEEYEQYMHQFHPVDYDPEEWVLLAKKAGMKYICFTAKHHDGFCMWDTKYTPYNIMNTPYKKDVLRMLADACEKHGMLLSLYYSNPDWHHENAYNPLSTHQWKSRCPEKADSEKYREFVKNQITELLTGYGKIYTLFWDIPPRYEDKSLNELARKLMPGILINNRGYDQGDFATPERNVPDGSRFPAMTEACESVGEQSWGYRSNEDYFSARFLMKSIDKIMAMGGSYLLNIGPMADGTLDPVHVARFQRIGDWYNRMQGCLESHEADPFDYGVCMTNDWIATKKDGKTYLHFFNGIPATAVYLANYPGLPVRARLMNTGSDLPCEIGVLPGFFSMENGCASPEYLSIRHIPVDELAGEPVVIELQW